MVPLAVHVPEFREDSIGREVVGKDDVLRVLDFLSSFCFVFFFLLHFCSSIFLCCLSRCKRERERERVLARGSLFFSSNAFSLFNKAQCKVSLSFSSDAFPLKKKNFTSLGVASVLCLGYQIFFFSRSEFWVRWFSLLSLEELLRFSSFYTREEYTPILLLLSKNRHTEKAFYYCESSSFFVAFLFSRTDALPLLEQTT